MQLERFEQVRPEFVKQLREELGLSLDKFWSAIGCTDTRGFRYESGQTEMPEVIKRLVFLHYGVGIPTDCQSAEFQRFVESVNTSETLNKALHLVDKMEQLIPQDQERAQ